MTPISKVSLTFFSDLEMFIDVIPAPEVMTVYS